MFGSSVELRFVDVWRIWKTLLSVLMSSRCDFFWKEDVYYVHISPKKIRNSKRHFYKPQIKIHLKSVTGSVWCIWLIWQNSKICSVFKSRSQRWKMFLCLLCCFISLLHISLINARCPYRSFHPPMEPLFSHVDINKTLWMKVFCINLVTQSKDISGLIY